ncbi:MAG: ferritin family protein [SAR324 cluster bacterium]|nr:ferritin family protein [SAR324 cluster bacterium]
MANIFYNADEIFEMAIEIEKNGEKFYAQAAELVEDLRVKKVLQRLRAMEAEHQGVFRTIYLEMKQQLDDPFVFDPEGQQALYLKAMADSHIFRADQEISEILGQKSSTEEILDLAIRFEKDSIALFLSMQEIVPDELGKDRISKLIQEEQTHILFITEHIAPISEVS